MLTVSGRRLFCNACREELSTKRSIIVSHIKSEKRSNGMVKLTMKGVHEKDIAKALLKYNEEVHLEGETLPVEQQVYGLKLFVHFYELEFLYINSPVSERSLKKTLCV